MIISKTNKFIFVANPKTATTSIAKIIKKYNDFVGPAHITQNEAKEILKNKNQVIDFSDYYEFVFVRHPYTRILRLYQTHGYANYRYLPTENTQKSNDPIDRIKSLTLDKYLDNYELILSGGKANSKAPFSQLIYTSQPASGNLHIFKFENLQESWAKIQSDLGLIFGDLPHLNHEINYNLNSLTIAQKARIFELFKEEFNQYNYTK